MALKNFDYYTTYHTPSPVQDDFRKVYVYKAGKVLVDGQSQREVGDNLAGFRNSGCTVETVFDDEGYREARARRMAERNALLTEFKADLFSEHGFELDNPKAERALRIAEDERSNLREIAELFDDLAQLIG